MNEMMIRSMMNWKGCGRKLSWLNFRYCPSICLEGLRKTTENLIAAFHAEI
jgi:hypothetical protein